MVEEGRRCIERDGQVGVRAALSGTPSDPRQTDDGIADQPRQRHDLPGMVARFFESALPTDGRMHSIDVRDVAGAFSAATTADVVGETLLIGGDETHLLRQGEVGKAPAAATGLTNVLPGGRPGDPHSETDWFVTDWMDTARSQRLLSFQQHSWPDMLAEMHILAG